MKTKAKKIDLDAVVLLSGAHGSRKQGMCAMAGRTMSADQLRRASEKLAEFTDKRSAEECWIWRGYSDPRSGYGMVNVAGLKITAHRLALALSGVDVPSGHDACHRCDVRLCVNPSHLFAGTRSENMIDCSRKGRHNKPRGETHWCAKLSADDVARIRRAVAAGETTVSVGRQFGVSHGTVSRIARREWRSEVA